MEGNHDFLAVQTMTGVIEDMPGVEVATAAQMGTQAMSETPSVGVVRRIIAAFGKRFGPPPLSYTDARRESYERVQYNGHTRLNP